MTEVMFVVGGSYNIFRSYEFNAAHEVMRDMKKTKVVELSWVLTLGRYDRKMVHDVLTRLRRGEKVALITEWCNEAAVSEIVLG